MKDNAKIMPYISTFELFLKKWPHLAYQILKPFIFLFLINIGITGDFEFGKWRLAEDSMEFTEDKQVHALSSFCIYNLLAYHEVSPMKSAVITISIGFLKEVYDVYVPWEEYGIWGGDGFSRYDMAYNIIGIVLAYGVGKFFEDWNVKVNTGLLGQKGVYMAVSLPFHAKYHFNNKGV